MKPAPFTYSAATSLEGCLDTLAAGDESTKIIAGGQSLLPLLALRMATPERLLDITRVSGLGDVALTRNSVRIGALVRHARLVTDGRLARALPLLPVAASHIGHLAIRNRGSLGGSLAHADPAAELPALMLLYRAHVACRSARRGERLVPAKDFFRGPYTTDLRDDELIIGVVVPAARRSAGGFVEFARRDGDFAQAGAACTVDLDRYGRIVDARAVLFAVRSTPLDVSASLSALLGRMSGSIDAGSVAAQTVEGLVSAEDSPYKRRLMVVALRRAIDQAMKGPQLNER